MRDFLKCYQIELEIMTPVHIGSGREITKKEYIYDRNTKQAWIPNQRKLLKDIICRNLADEFERYMLSGKEPLLNWMKSQGYQDREIRALCSYHLDCSQALANLNRPLAIQQFMKDAYGMPYIPGSSLKGAVRSAILGSRILREPARYRKLRQSVVTSNDKREDGRPNRKYLAVEGRKIEVAAFHTLSQVENRMDAKNDEFKGIRISDSAPIKPECLVLCQKIDIDPEGNRNPLNILRESLIPGTVVRFDLTIDESVTLFDAGDLVLALNDTWKFYQNAYVKKFLKHPAAETGNLYLGGGCGFGTKTVLYELLEERERMQVIPRLMNLRFKKHGHQKDARMGVSPHMLKCTSFGGRICEMGKCKFELVECAEISADAEK